MVVVTAKQSQIVQIGGSAVNPGNDVMSLGPFGTVAGFQLVAVFQSPLAGLRFQVALPA